MDKVKNIGLGSVGAPIGLQKAKKPRNWHNEPQNEQPQIISCYNH